MQLSIIMKINTDEKQKQFLRENSYWYKYLNRSNDYYYSFLKEMKEKYKLTTSDKLNNIMKNINMVSTILDVLK